MAQARTDAQPSRAGRGLMGLGDDCLHKVMTFLAVADARRGVGAAAKWLRTTATSPALARARFCEPYTLRGEGGTGESPRPGVVHAMATALGTRQWPMVAVSNIQADFNRERGTINFGTVDARAPPPALSISINRGAVIHDELERKAADKCFAHGIVDQVLDRNRDDVLSLGSECSCPPGALVEYTLPFQIVLSDVRFAFGCCWASDFFYWVLEAFDREQDGWRVLYDSEGVSPWPGLRHNEIGYHRRFTVDTAFASSKFRIRVTNGHQCMHIRGLELFGTILPPWRID